MVRFELMDKFGYYVTESSEHNAEYHPYFIKSRYPELIGQFNIPLDEYPRRCEEQINNWNTMKHDLVETHKSRIRALKNMVHVSLKRLKRTFPLNLVEMY